MWGILHTFGLYIFMFLSQKGKHFSFDDTSVIHQCKQPRLLSKIEKKTLTSEKLAIPETQT
jgi:hypothetical protein